MSKAKPDYTKFMKRPFPPEAGGSADVDPWTVSREEEIPWAEVIPDSERQESVGPGEEKGSGRSVIEFPRADLALATEDHPATVQEMYEGKTPESLLFPLPDDAALESLPIPIPIPVIPICVLVAMCWLLAF